MEESNHWTRTERLLGRAAAICSFDVLWVISVIEHKRRFREEHSWREKARLNGWW